MRHRNYTRYRDRFKRYPRVPADTSDRPVDHRTDDEMLEDVRRECDAILKEGKHAKDRR